MPVLSKFLLSQCDDSLFSIGATNSSLSFGGCLKSDLNIAENFPVTSHNFLSLFVGNHFEKRNPSLESDDFCKKSPTSVIRSRIAQADLLRQKITEFSELFPTFFRLP